MSCKPCLTCCGALLLCASIALADATQRIPTLGVPGDGAQPERVGQGAPRGAECTCEGDANGDGTIDPLDAGFVLARFGCEVGVGDPSCDCADQNGDLEVDPLDSGFVLARFGLPCEPIEECSFNNGAFDTTVTAPGTQWDFSFPFFAQAADNFTLVGDDENPCLITEIVFYASPYNPGCSSPANWTGVRVVVYNDNGANTPDGEPVDDGTISGGPPVRDVQVSPDAYTSIDLGGNDFEITMNVALQLDQNVMYWLAISPIMDFTPDGQVAWGSTDSFDGIPSVQHFAVAGLPDWTPVSEGAQDLAFTLSGSKSVDASGACCSDGICTEDVEVLACQSPFDRFVLDGTCDDVDPPCGGGACCFADGSCTETADAEECEGGAGDFQGPGTLCSSAGCPQPPPDNDNCADSITVVDGATAFSTDGATTDGPVDGAAGACADDFVGNNDVWFDYTVSCDGFLNISMCDGCVFDTTLQVYDGLSCELGEQVACGDDTCDVGGGPSQVNLCSVVAGTELKIRVGSWNDGTLGDVTGDAVLTITCSAENHDCCDPVGPAGCPGCNDKEIEGCVCGLDPFCCDVQWDEACVEFGELFCDLVCE